MVNRKSNAAVKVQTTMLDQAASLLGDLPEKPDSTISLRQAIEMLQQDLRESLDKGYDYDELARVLAEQEIDISPSTLKRYLAMSQKDPAQPRRTRRSRKAHAEDISGDFAEDAESELEAIAG
ncbi:MAG: hypothetical protein KME13_17520 [Myxacorys californica WJT36-NPBG1]|jgi:hypothetical protein|nr:hypothetical protein [Myxacorys californica WJT36-NPBG1]